MFCLPLFLSPDSTLPWACDGPSLRAPRDTEAPLLGVGTVVALAKSREEGGSEQEASQTLRDNSALGSGIRESVQSQGDVHGAGTHGRTELLPGEHQESYRLPRKPGAPFPWEAHRPWNRLVWPSLTVPGQPFQTCALPAGSLRLLGDPSPVEPTPLNLASNLSKGWAEGCGTGGNREGPRARTVPNSQARWDLRWGNP